jgi:hypothetical protein
MLLPALALLLLAAPFDSPAATVQHDGHALIHGDMT